MTTFLTGFLICCLAILILISYLIYHRIVRKRPSGATAIKIIVLLMIAECIGSAYLAYTGDLTLASVIVWAQAVALIVTIIFILLLIIFKPNWN